MCKDFDKNGHHHGRLNPSKFQVRGHTFMASTHTKKFVTVSPPSSVKINNRSIV